MNRSIRRVFWGVVILFALLAANTARWSVIEAKSLKQNSLNKIPALRELREPRGPILTKGGATIARSVRIGSGDQRIYSRRYPQGSLFGHPVGYSYVQRGANGLERYYDDQLVGRREEFTSVLDSLLGRDRDPHTMSTSLDKRSQEVATSGLAGRAGAVVVIEPRTGRIPVYVSVPGYNPNKLRSDAGFEALSQDKDAPMFDRVAQAAYPPGSTFKVVATAAALDSGLLTPNSMLDGSSPQDFSGTPLANFAGESFGQVSLTTALTKSINTVLGQVGERVGAKRMVEYMKRFGFYAKPPIDLPADEVVASGLRSRTGDLLPDSTPIDVARVAIGQERLAVTPLQMATVAATIANGGQRMAPRLGHLFRDKYGRVKKRVKPDAVERVISKRTASQLNRMMQNVVNEGTGTAAALAGVSVAGKTGTAEIKGGAANQAWFIGFAPAKNPRYAIAVTVQETTGQGGTVAAPIARDVLKNLLR